MAQLSGLRGIRIACASFGMDRAGPSQYTEIIFNSSTRRSQIPMIDQDTSVARRADCDRKIGRFGAFSRSDPSDGGRRTARIRHGSARRVGISSHVNGRLSSAAVALVCGFVDQGHLTRAFTSIVSTSPSTSRRAIAEQRRRKISQYYRRSGAQLAAVGLAVHPILHRSEASRLLTLARLAVRPAL
jgi:hypothetical protein